MTRKKRAFLFVLTVVFLVVNAPAAFAQQEPSENEKKSSTDLVAKVSASQAGYQNWTKGGVNTLAVATTLEGKTSYVHDGWEQKHEMKLAFGLVKQDTLDFRKADDVIQVNSSLQYMGDGFFKYFNPTAASQIRTQFAPGFNYKNNPFAKIPQHPLGGLKVPVKVSDLFSPATFTQSLGLTYDPAAWITQRIGIGAKETVVLIDRFRELYGNDDNAVQFELGVESRTQFDKEVLENVQVKSSLGLFTAFNKTDLPDLLWENSVIMKVNSWLGVNFQLEALYDRDLSKRMQLKEVFSLGVSIVII